MITIPLQSWNQLVQDAGDAADEFEVLPAADYDMKVVKAEAKQTKTGKVTFALRSEVTSGPYKGRKVFSNLTVSPESPTALGIFFRQMAALGISKDFFSQNPSDSQVAEALQGREFRAQVAIRTWQGQERNDIKTYSRVAQTAAAGQPGPPAPPMSTPSPISSPPAFAGAAPRPAPTTPPPAASAAPEKTATVDATPAPEPIKQADLPPVVDSPVEAVTEAIEASTSAPEPIAAATTSVTAPEDPF